MEMIVKAIENDQTYPNYAIHPEFEYKQSMRGAKSFFNDPYYGLYRMWFHPYYVYDLNHPEIDHKGLVKMRAPSGYTFNDPEPRIQHMKYAKINPRNPRMMARTF